jgi:hypothetical protein
MVGIDCLDGLESEVTNHIDGIHTNEKIILDDQDGNFAW